MESDDVLYAHGYGSSGKGGFFPSRPAAVSFVGKEEGEYVCVTMARWIANCGWMTG